MQLYHRVSSKFVLLPIVPYAAGLFIMMAIGFAPVYAAPVPTPKADASYFPLAKGTIWHYELRSCNSVYMNDGSCDEISEYHIVSNVSKVDNGTMVSVSRKSGNESDDCYKLYYKLMVTSSGIYRTQWSSDMLYKPYWPLIRYPLVNSTSWPVDLTLTMGVPNNSKPSSFSKRVVGAMRRACRISICAYG